MKSPHDYGLKAQQQFLAKAASRTPIVKPETRLEAIAGGVAFTVFVLLIMFI